MRGEDEEERRHQENGRKWQLVVSSIASTHNETGQIVLAGGNQKATNVSMVK